MTTTEPTAPATDAYETVTLDIPAAQVRQSDTILDAGVTYGPIATVDRKVKRVYFTTDANPSPFFRQLDDTVTVQRRQMTKAEQERQRRAYAIRSLTSTMTETIEGYEAKTAAFAARLASGYGVDHYDLTKLLRAQAEYRIWAEISRNLDTIDNRTAEQGEDYEYFGWTIYDVVRERVEEYTAAVIDAAARGTSRSSDTMANAADEVENAAKAEFVRTFRRWYR